MELKIKKLVTLEPKTFSDPILPLVGSQTQTENYSCAPSGRLNQLQEQPVSIPGTVVVEQKVPGSAGGCTLAPEFGSLAGSNQLHTEPVSGTTAQVN